jgi:hypothetical protein
VREVQQSATNSRNVGGSSDTLPKSKHYFLMFSMKFTKILLTLLKERLFSSDVHQKLFQNLISN